MKNSMPFLNKLRFFCLHSEHNGNLSTGICKIAMLEKK